MLGPWFIFENRLSLGFQSLAETPNLVGALEKRGFKADAIEKIMGGNLMRVYAEVWGG